MPTGRRLCAIVILMIWPAVISGPARGEMRGPPTIIDGDTIEVAGQTVRLYGVDAPELGQTCVIKEQAYDCGKIARTALLDLTAGVQVVCRLVAENTAKIPAEGQLGRCFADGYDLSEGMAYTGWALAEREVSTRYSRFEDGARSAKRGLWRGRFITPWAWRDGRRLSLD